jgi:hypothetical protein
MLNSLMICLFDAFAFFFFAGGVVTTGRQVRSNRLNQRIPTLHPFQNNEKMKAATQLP